MHPGVPQCEFLSNFRHFSIKQQFIAMLIKQLSHTTNFIRVYTIQLRSHAPNDHDFGNDDGFRNASVPICQVRPNISPEIRSALVSCCWDIVLKRPGIAHRVVCVVLKCGMAYASLGDRVLRYNQIHTAMAMYYHLCNRYRRICASMLWHTIR